MDDDLIGYLMGALEPDEMRRIEQRLRDEPALRAQLEKIEAQLEPLEAADQPLEPPCGLADRVLEAIDDDRTPPARMRPEAEVAGGGQGRVVDYLFSAVAATALVALIMPALWQTRIQSRVDGCQDQLRLLGQHLTRYATHDPARRIPGLSLEGPEAFSGIYSVRLREAGMLDETRLLWCPSMPQPPERLEIPDLQTLFSADARLLQRLQQLAGGSYAYNLGVIERERYAAPRYEGRTHFAYLADRPLDPDSTLPPPHSGRGINVLYEDGHVRLVPLHATFDGRDHLFLNHHGTKEAGVTPQDATLAPSGQGPFLWVKQRR